MRKGLFTILLLVFCSVTYASHITGGEMYYEFVGVNNGIYKYRVHLKLFMRCNSGRQFNNPAIMSVFTKTGTRVKDISVPLTKQENIALPANNKCITDPPIVCYDVGFYDFDVEVPASATGYVIAVQVVFRIAGISNLTPGYGNIGATYTAEIPGNVPLGAAPENNSAHFVGSDLVVICAQNAFSYSFAAEDADKDELRYSFAPAYQGGSNGGNNNGNPSSAPPFSSVPYGNDYGYDAPLGFKAKIDSKTGLIKGIAPVPGIYVVTVQVEEIRNGVVIATQRKDLQIHITNCSIAAASIDDEYSFCKESTTIDLANASTSPLITSYLWEFYQENGNQVYSTTSSTVNYSFADTGVYTIKLYVNKGQECSDSATALAYVYPGFKPDFKTAGNCLNKPTQFTDLTVSKYGTVNSWSWFFDDNIVGTSTQKNPVYTYQYDGAKQPRLIVTDSKGCRDTIIKKITITDKPSLDLAFKDTLICDKDAVQLLAKAPGIYSWTPTYNMAGANSSNPTVQPKYSLYYYADLNQNGCLGRDSVFVRVTDHVDLSVMPDSVICQGDSALLRIQSNGFQYTWTPSIGLNNSAAKQPTAIVNNTTQYNVTAYIGTCSAKSSVKINTAAYPIADAGKDTIICYNSSTQLFGALEGNSFTWSPAGTLLNANTLAPTAKPFLTTDYILTVFTQNGCPKPDRDTVRVTVLPDVNTFAGRDTSVIIGQPLQLNGSGGIQFSWTPSMYINTANIAAPIATFNSAADKIVLKLVSADVAGCKDSAYINIKVFSTVPEVFVPTAFTPNNDGKNDKLKPVAVGMQKIERFTVFNRWGQVVYNSVNTETGWDGTVNGKEQTTGTFAWMVSAIDYLGKPYTKTGTVVLIR